MSEPLNDCGCCEGLTAQTPVEIANRPGLSVIAYRAGTHVSFKVSMLAQLSSATLLALAALHTREDDDFSIALLDAWATVADVLTFYQERIAHESYLRTATERLSLIEMARLIGYEPRPGVAASTLLAFTLEDAPGAPLRTTIAGGVKTQSVPGPGEMAQTFETVEEIEARVAWNSLKPQSLAPQTLGATTKQLFLRGTSTQLQAGDAIIIVGAAREIDPLSTSWAFRILQKVEAETERNYTRVTWDEALPAGLASPKVFALRQRAALFGHNAPDWRLMPAEVKAAYDPDGIATEWPNFKIQDGLLDLDAAYPRITKNSWFVLAKPEYAMLHRVADLTAVSRADYALSTKITRLKPDRPLTLLPLRSVTVFAVSEPLERAAMPVTTPVSGDSIVLDHAVDGLTPGRLIIAAGYDATNGAARTEVVEVLRAESVGDATRLVFKTPLNGAFRRDDFVLLANVARATHGESVQEILGSGDASRPYQRFTLRQPPLTYLSAATPSGAASTLQVRVNDLLWQEVAALYGRGPRERVFVTRTGDDGKTTVQFGDGQNGARPPSGQENVRTVYRKGSGLDGLVEANQISLLLTRPLGVKGVTNPLPATGAAAPETRDDARANAPLTVRTLERVVSLRDYEDFARAFAGVAKALASWTWQGRSRVVFLTIAGPDGAIISPDSVTAQNLVAALRQAGDPFARFRVASYRPAFFPVAANLAIDEPTYERDTVLAAAQLALATNFSFAARDFGQPVALSEIIATLQAVPGVVAVDVNRLHRSDRPRSLQSRLEADQPASGADGTVAAAELLSFDAAASRLGVMSS